MWKFISINSLTNNKAWITKTLLSLGKFQRLRVLLWGTRNKDHALLYNRPIDEHCSPLAALPLSSFLKGRTEKTVGVLLAGYETNSICEIQEVMFSCRYKPPTLCVTQLRRQESKLAISLFLSLSLSSFFDNPLKSSNPSWSLGSTLLTQLFFFIGAQHYPCTHRPHFCLTLYFNTYPFSPSTFQLHVPLSSFQHL